MIEAFKSALRSIWANKVRSVLTVLGIVIGVASVTILVSLGQGLKDEVAGLIRGFGTNIITIIPGKVDTKNTSSLQTNPANFVSNDVLTLEDLKAISQIEGVKSAAPIALVPGNLSYGDKKAVPMIGGTYSNMTEAIDLLSVEQGRFFKSNNEGNVIVISKKIKNDLFGEQDALGKKIKIGNEDFEVIGIFGEVKAQSIFGGIFDSLTVMPFDTATRLNKNQVNIHRITVKVADNRNVAEVKDKIFKKVLELHSNEENFTVLTQDDILGLFDNFLGLATTLVSAIAAISLVVGGIGIMNIMLVTVTERTKEIGLRKAVGATKLAIARQFLVESIMVTMVGGVIGLLISFGVGWVVAAKTSLTPSITLNTILIAMGVSVVVGIVFGLWPALRAANKDPIEALHYE